jgi:hypothetical protein
VVIGVAGAMMAIALLSPALAVKLATTSYVKQKVNQAFNRTFGQFLQQPIAIIRSDPISVGTGVAQAAAIACPPGGVATGGGATGADVSEDWELEASYPSNGASSTAGATGWAVVMQNQTAGTLAFRVYALCAGGTSFTNFPPGSPPRAADAAWAPGSTSFKPEVATRALPR